ncbi:MAG: arylesterase [Rhodobacteraceae bacterium]|nr:arylesterase [Paracoccaceae bacterium]
MNKMLMCLALVVTAGLARAETVTVAALGDSLTQGYGLVPDDGFVPQLQDWLDERDAQAVVLNAGVSGDTTAGGAARAAWTLTPEVDAMIVALGGNDMLRGIDPEVSRANLTRILQAARDAEVPVLLIGMEAPGNYGADYKQRFDAMYPDLAARFDALYLDSFFAGMAPSGGDPAALMPLMQADGIHPNAQGVMRVVEGIGPHVLRLIQRARPDAS